MYDAIIVGAGPAGSSAAIYCNKLGLNTLLLDKSIFPRDKICGDALSGKSVKILEELDLLQDLDKLDGAIVNRIIFFFSYHSECELHLNKSLNKIRDIFLFACYTGLSYIDLYNLKIKNIQIGDDNLKWIFIKRHN